MNRNPSDPLLFAGRILVIISQAVVALAAIAIAIGLPILFLIRDRITAELQAELADPSVVFPVVPVVGVLLMALGILALAFFFLRNLRRIIDTVGEGDPFAPVNAERLTEMGWFALAAQILAVPAAGLALYISKLLQDEFDMTVDAGLSLEGVTLVVLLFILARVFRHGAQMREDLEGTV